VLTWLRASSPAVVLEPELLRGRSVSSRGVSLGASCEDIMVGLCIWATSCIEAIGEETGGEPARKGCMTGSLASEAASS